MALDALHGDVVVEDDAVAEGVDLAPVVLLEGRVFGACCAHFVIYNLQMREGSFGIEAKTL